ncbi:MAG: hypothetical protein IBGAMO2_580043 [Arenicellales bacterium IbO2]|nr:phospholipase D-like domain-containing protein [Gammaproteobacteria bacterium]MDA7994683.1 phospholipase D-like domain-containing protein [Gammaproteobacteria bacterium]MDA8023254.1 phospholipase D-like domain-containing protein [Gammaproteobacteria bacterium]MDA8040963.1 phospholipase D-like domain-containing protein [Pirellulales bacterium]CAJ2377146.1 MAG: hypothetical protein IBGAMO2_580043 [Arenicellales bacterium IbO2]
MKPVIHPEPRPEILYTRLFKQKFERCLGLRPTRLDMVVPYIGGNPWGSPRGTCADFARLLMQIECDLHLITLQPGTENATLSADQAEELLKIGVELQIHTGNRLHAKIYQFSFARSVKMAFVGSANFSMGGLVNNHETVAFFTARSDNVKVASEIHRISLASIDYFPHFGVPSK